MVGEEGVVLHLKSIIATIFAVLILLSGCQNQSVFKIVKEQNQFVIINGKTIESVTVSMIGKDMNDVEDPYIVYEKNDVNEIKALVNAIKKAKKVQGIINVVKADYQFSFIFIDGTSEAYFLWLNVDSGSLMHGKDTHTLYTLPKDVVEELRLKLMSFK